ncbi:hypothetical protein ONA92_21610 [Mycobacteroides salmoniphilum]|uniref:hypothetical protein n=1 Tax=Mycobacteroides salmoniphilum TaxID=404941 RepID=UPI0035669C14
MTAPKPGSIWLERNGKRWPLPFELYYQKGELPTLNLIDTLHPGDRIELPGIATSRPAWVDVAVWPPNARQGDTGWFTRKTSPRRIPMVFNSFDTCPACATETVHHIEVPELDRFCDTDWSWGGYPVRRYVLRTCITCANSWEQEAA